MTDNIPSDHNTIDSHRVHLTTVGHTSRLQVPLPETLECTLEDVVYLSLEGKERHAQVTPGLRGDQTLQGAFANRQLARTEQAENELRRWFEECSLGEGDPLALDVLRAGYAYGLRRPGERVVYSPPEPPDTGLADIASSLEE